jgi:hypothetical protein
MVTPAQRAVASLRVTVPLLLSLEAFWYWTSKPVVRSPAEVLRVVSMRRFASPLQKREALFTRPRRVIRTGMPCAELLYAW